MMKKKILTALIGISMLLLLLAPSTPFIPLLNTNLSTKIEGNRVDFGGFSVAALTDDIPTGTPIVLKATDFQLPYSMLQTAVVMDSGGTIAYPTQCDDLNGDNIIDEIVFLAPSDINAPMGTLAFRLYGTTEGTSNGYTADADLKVAEDTYNESYGDWLLPSYSDTFMNGSSLSSYVDEVGEVVWADTNWGTFCLYVSAGWRQSSWKHIITKGPNAVDLVMADYNATDNDRWQWTKFGYEADQGWHNGDTPDVVTIAKAGPLRIVIQTESGIGYNGLFGIDDGLKARRTFILYKSIPGIIRNLQLIGENGIPAFQSMTDYYGAPLTMASKFVPHDQNTSTTPWTPKIDAIDYNTVYAPNDPGLATNDSRYQSNGDLRKFNMSEVTAPWFSMYDSGSDNGFIVNFGNFDYVDQEVTKIDWSDGEIDVYYSFEYFPANGLDTVLIPVDGGDVTSTIVDYMTNLNGNWTQEYLVTFVPYLKEPWVTTTVEIVIETTIEITTVIVTQNVTVNSTVVEYSTVDTTVISEVFSTLITTVIESAPGFELIFVLLVGAVVFVRRRRK